MPSVISQPLSDCLWKQTRLRVPADDGSLYAVPCFKKGVQLAEENRTLLENSPATLLGETLSQFRIAARQEVIEAAKKYLTELVGSPQCACEEHLSCELNNLFVGGHQPALFHPGVWVKNFGINNMATSAGGTALNLIVDNDVITSTHLNVPAGSRENPTAEQVLFDDPALVGLPWEEAAVADKKLFASFAERLTTHMNQWGIQPLVTEVWETAINKMNSSASLRDCMTAVRVQQERAWGIHNLELPISHLCQLNSFSQFALHLLFHLDEFQTIHNQTLAEYRTVYHVRSKTHPVPELINFGDGWLEAPFWIWQAGDQQRQRLRVKRDGDSLILSNGEKIITTLSTKSDEKTSALSALKEISQTGWKLRTRALTTTLFARLAVADLFVHGIGGAKYDELTDQIICRFFKMPAPEFSTMSATLFLPIATPFDVTAEEETELKNKLRDLQYNPNRNYETGEDATIDNLIDEQHQLISQQHARVTSGESRKVRRDKTPDNRSRYLRLKEINEELETCATEQKQQLQSELIRIQAELAANRILKNREFSFALYPAEMLSSFLLSIGN